MLSVSSSDHREEVKSPIVSMKRTGLRTRLARLFVMQVVVIGVATMIGVYLTQLIVEDLLTRKALNLESAHYWQLLERNPLQPLPDTANMRGYLVPGSDDLPSTLIDFGSTYGRAELAGRSVLVHVSTKDQKTLYLVFEGDQVSSLAFYFGTLPLSIVLLLMYLLLFVAYRLSQRALSPVERLARMLESINIERGERFDMDLKPDRKSVV